MDPQKVKTIAGAANIAQIKNDISEIKEGVAYLKGKAAGA